MVATWVESLRKASWRGVGFFWSDATTTIDPMVVVHKYPQRRGGWSEDLGLGPDEFEVVGYVLGPDYMVARDRLIKACKEGGPGTLVHPTLGDKTVVLKPPVRMQESTREGGMARFTLVFAEEGENKYPVETVVTAGAVAAAAEVAKAATASDFGQTFDTGGLDLLELDAAQALTGVASTISDAFGALRAVTRTVSGVISLLSGPINAPMSIIRDTLGLGETLASLFGGLSGGSSAPSATLASLSLVADRATTIKTTSASAQQDINRAALERLVRRQAAIASAQTAVAAQYGSRDDAIAARDQAVGLLDACRISDGATGDVFASLTDLRAVVVRAMGEKAGTLASVRRIDMAESMPATLLAYRELGDGSRAGDLVARNRAQIWHPLFVPAGATIEVLND